MLEAFQATVDDVLVRHRSMLDVLTKLQEADSRLARAAAKAVTACGCISITANRQRIPADAHFKSWHLYVRSHVDGTLCARCRDALETEFGQSLFYQSALASLLEVDLSEVLERELNRLKALGIFNLS
jgi:hypothetical protein